MLAEHEAMFFWIARKYCQGLTEDAVEDVAAAVRAQFVRACQTYDPSTGYKLSTYAIGAAYHVARRAANAERFQGIHLPDHRTKAVVLPPVSLDNTIEGLPDSRNALVAADTVAAPSAERPPELPGDFWDRILAPLRPNERDVLLWAHRDNLTLREMGQRLNLSRERCRQILLTAEAKLRDDPVVQRLWEEVT